MKPGEFDDLREHGPLEKARDALERYERSVTRARDEELRRSKEPVGTQEHIPGYGEAPAGIRTLRLPDEAPKKTTIEEEEEQS